MILIYRTGIVWQTSVILPASHMQVPVAIGSVSIGVIRHFAQKRKHRRRNGKSQEEEAVGQKQVALEWDSISCTITSKKGGTKEILQDVSGEAKPGRYASETCMVGYQV